MTVEREVIIALESETICQFLQSDNQVYDHGIDESVVRARDLELLTAERVLAMPPDTDPADEELSVSTTIRKMYSVIDDRSGLEVTKCKVDDRVDHRLRVELYAKLYGTRELVEVARVKVVEEFAAFEFGHDVDVVIARLVADGIQPSDYHVFLSFRLYRSGPAKPDDSGEQALKRAARGYGEGSRVAEVSRSQLCTTVERDFSVTGHQIEVTNPEAADNELDEWARRKAKEMDCGDICAVTRKLATVDLVPETRIEWREHRVKILWCTIKIVWIKEVYVRRTLKVLYGQVLVPRDIAASLEKVIAKCIETSAIGAAVGLVLTGMDFATALAVFKIAVGRCLVEAVPDSVLRCVQPELVIATAKLDWHKV